MTMIASKLGLSRQSLFRRLKAEGMTYEKVLDDLRHTMATTALVAGIHPKIVQERLGHSSIAMTLDTYSHVTPNMQEDAATRIGALLRSE